MFFRYATPLFASAVLAACGGSGDTVEARNESVESVAKKVAQSDIRPRPGRWESQMTIDKMEIAGMPKEMEGMMKDQFSMTQTAATCLTAEDVDKPDAEFFKPGEDSGCTYDTFSMGGGKVDAVMTCAAADGGKQTMKMSGTYTQEGYEMKVATDGQAEPGKPMSMAMTVKARRVGDCKGDEI